MADTPRRPLPGRTWPQRLVLAAGVLVVLVSGLAAAGATYFGLRLSQIDRVGDIDIAGAPRGEPANFLLVGTDSRKGLDPDLPGFSEDGETGCDCTDTIMVLRVDPRERTASILSFPRDLLVEIAGTGKVRRINTAYAEGEQALIDTIEDEFGIPIHHYVEVDFVGFERLVDAIGGVPLWFDAPVRDTQTGLSVTEAGCQVLDGDQARKFVRSRYLQYRDEDGRWQQDPTADLGRITRQQIFVRRAVAKAVSRGLTNPVTLNEMVSAGVENVRLDELLDASDLLDLGRRFASFDADTLIGYSLPTEPYTTSAGYGGEELLERRAEPVLNIFRGLPPGTVTPGAIDLTVLNGSGIEGQANDAAAALSTIGFAIEEVASFPGGPIPRTTVRFGDGGESAARRVARHVTGGADLVYDPDVDDGEVVLITGSDFTTVHDQPAPEGSPDDLRSTTSSTAATPTSAGGTSTSAPGATTTTAPEPVGYGTGEPPPGVPCG
ncbi:MAG: LCP family protein [Acidimicrobiia bacterium]